MCRATGQSVLVAYFTDSSPQPYDTATIAASVTKLASDRVKYCPNALKRYVTQVTPRPLILNRWVVQANRSLTWVNPLNVPPEA